VDLGPGGISQWEPYFDVDFKEVLYLTDTGRRWDGDAFNIRDKVGEEREKWKEERANRKGEDGNRKWEDGNRNQERGNSKVETGYRK